MSKSNTPWTLFWDMNSGGGKKEKHSQIYIQAPKKEAEVIFYNRYGHNPHRVSCTCCGADYEVQESRSIEQASGYHRDCDFAYFNLKDEEVPSNEAWKRGKGLLPGYHSGYAERVKTGGYGKYRTVEEFESEDHVLFIREDEIGDEERVGHLPEEGYIWV